MPLRKLLLWLMLVSLALSAVAGVLAILLAGRELIWSVVGTGVSTAIAAAVLIPISLLMDRPKARAAGLLGMAAAIITYLISLALIWQISLSTRLYIEQLAETLLTVILEALPAMFFLRMARSDRGKWAGPTGAAVCAITFVVAMAGIWGDFGDDIPERLMDSFWVLAGCGALAAASLGGVGFDRRHWRWVGVAAAAASCAIGLIGAWVMRDSGGATMVVVTGVAVIFAHANLAFLCPVKGGQQWVRLIAIAAVVLSVALIDVGTFVKSSERYTESIWRGAGAAAIVGGCASLALLVLWRLNRRVFGAAAPANIGSLEIICPWCHRRQTLALGTSRCAGCGLRFQIKVEEPRCPNCDYLLYMLASDRCPECGTALGGADQEAQAGAVARSQIPSQPGSGLE